MSKTSSLWPITALYIRLFLVTGASFGILMALFTVPVSIYLFSSSSGLFLGFLMALGTGVAYGAVMALILGSAHLGAVASYGVSHNNLQMRHTRQIDLRMPSDEAFRLCLNLLVTDIRARIHHEDRELGIIEAVTSVNWLSWGTRISVVLQQSGDGTRVEIETHPRVKITMVDYGVGLRIAQRLSDLLRYSTPQNEPVA